jgi:hypothetical protein
VTYWMANPHRNLLIRKETQGVVPEVGPGPLPRRIQLAGTTLARDHSENWRY